MEARDELARREIEATCILGGGAEVLSGEKDLKSELSRVTSKVVFNSFLPHHGLYTQFINSSKASCTIARAP